MGRVSRRGFLKGSAAVGGAVAASRFLSSPLETLAASRGANAVESWVPSACWIGKQDCGVLARKVNGRVVKIEGHPDHPRNVGRLCPKGVGQITALYDPNRVKTPLIRTNEKGVPGHFRLATWDEALTKVAEKIKEYRARDPKLIMWQKGRSKAGAFYEGAFVKALGPDNKYVGHGAYCSDAGYRAAEYTIGPSGNAHPDFRYTKYLLSWGWNVTGAGGNKLCWITWNRQFLDAKKRGMKVVHIDPRLRSAGPHADEWLPIKPGTDLALGLALCNAIIANGTIDRDYLTNYTNAPFLIQDDGTFLRVEGKEQVWDTATEGPKPYDAAGLRPALEGTFYHQGKAVKPAFQLFKENVAQNRPEWAAEVCGLPAEDIKRVARELGENAMIGATIVVDGVTLPYRPVSVMAYHVSQQELGFQYYRVMYIIMMLLGAVEAVGGLRVDFTWSEHANYKALESIKVKDPPYDYTLKDSKFFPINSVSPGMINKVNLNPQKYQVEKVPEMLIIHMSNPLVAFTDEPLFMEAYNKFKFVAVIDPWLSKTADLFADVVLPAATMEKYEGPLGVTDQYVDAVTLRLPVMEPMFQSKGDIDIYLDLCEKAGILTGRGGYLDKLNGELKLREPHILDISTKPRVRDIFDSWAKSQGIAEGVRFFEEKGVLVKGRYDAKKYYGYAQNPPFGGIRARLWGEALLRYQKEMQAKGADKIYWQDYTPFPYWREPTMWKSPAQYDLNLISFKKIEFKQSRGSMIRLLAELAPEQHLSINPTAARARGIKDGDLVTVESQNALTGETRKVRVRAELTEGIRPDTVGMSHHYGEVAQHPATKDQGPTPNTLFFAGEGYAANTADNSFHVRVRVHKE